MPHHHRYPDASGRQLDESSTEVSVPSSPKRRSGPLWKKFRAVCVLLLLLGTTELGIAAFTSSHFDVTQVRLAGLRNTASSPVKAVAKQLVGQNWLHSNSDAVVQKIEQIPTVDSVQVRRVWEWPLQLEVVVQERQPFVLIGGGQDWWVVDAKGVPYAHVKQQVGKNLEAVSGPNFHPQLGKKLPAGQWKKVVQLVSAVEQDQRLAQNGFSWNLRRISFDDKNNVTLRLNDPHDEVLVQLGANEWERKLERARVALAYLDRSGQSARVLNFVSYKIPTWIPQDGKTASNHQQKDKPESNAQGAA